MILGLESDSTIGITESPKINTFWFCSLLVFEVYSLAIALGGQWVETSCFMLICVAQIISGAFIWIRLRKGVVIPLPELIAMGFVIGVTIAAISQLIIRDLLQMKPLLSPFIPIVIGANCLHSSKRSRISYKITHADSNTLLWLLLPAPIAVSHYLPDLLFTFVFPLICIILVYKRVTKGGSTKKNSTQVNYIQVLVALFVLGIVTKIFSFFIRDSKSAISLIGPDDLYDFSNGRGFAIWGLEENILGVGHSFSLYKFTHLWLGPIIENTPSATPVLLTSVLLFLLLTIFSCALWAFTLNVTKKNKIAYLTPLIFVLHATLPEPYALPMRPLYLLANIFIVSAVLILNVFSANSKQLFCSVTIVAFVLASLRLQYAIILLTGVLISQGINSMKDKKRKKGFVVAVLATVLGLFLSYIIFYSRFPIGESSRKELYFLLNRSLAALTLPVLLPAALLTLAGQKLRIRGYPSAVVLSGLLYHFSFPQHEVMDGLWVVLIISSPLLPLLISTTFSAKKSVRYLFLLICLFGTGMLLRFSFDNYQYVDPQKLGSFKRLLQFFSGDGSQTTELFIVAACIFTVQSFRGARLKLMASSVAFALVCYLVGIGIATNLRSITRELRYDDTIFTPIQENQISQWFMNEDFKKALVDFLKVSKTEDIFSSNFPAEGSLTVVSITGRRVLFEPRYGIFSKEIYPDYEFREKISFEFAYNPNRDHAEYLNDLSVKWFIVDLERTKLRTWEPWAETRFINSRIAILELNPEGSD